MIKNRLLLFWKIGKVVFNRQKKCDNAISKYSLLCSYYYGMSETFSRENIKKMLDFYKCFPIYIKELSKLEWEHYLELLKINNKEERYFYFKTTIFCNGSVGELRKMIDINVYKVI